jgi:hypothetical protein
MLSLPTAKVLLFIALNLTPHASKIYATGGSGGYVFNGTSAGWSVESKGFPSSDFTRDPTQSTSLNGNPPESAVPHYLGAITRHDWSHNTAMIFDNGDRVEKHGDYGFYIINAGGANEQVFTFFFWGGSKS